MFVGRGDAAWVGLEDRGGCLVKGSGLVHLQRLLFLQGQGQRRGEVTLRALFGSFVAFWTWPPLQTRLRRCDFASLTEGAAPGLHVRLLPHVRSWFVQCV